MGLGIATGSAVVELNRVEGSGRDTLASLVEPAARVWADLAASTRDTIRALVNDFEAREQRLSRNAFGAGENPLANISTDIDEIFENIAGLREIFTVDGSAGKFSYSTIRNTAASAAERLAKRDPSIGENVGNHISTYATSSSGANLQRMADYCSYFQAGLTKAREQVLDALRNVID